MAAPGNSISSMFWNPAAVTTVTSTTIEGNLSGVFPRSELDVDPSRSTLTALGITGNGGNVGETGIAPAGYLAVPVTDELYFGLSFTAPYGLTTTSHASASIGASYNWNERFSIDAGYSHIFVDDGHRGRNDRVVQVRRYG